MAVFYITMIYPLYRLIKPLYNPKGPFKGLSFSPSALRLPSWSPSPKQLEWQAAAGLLTAVVRGRFLAREPPRAVAEAGFRVQGLGFP